jgi:hypothetical protein
MFGLKRKHDWILEEMCWRLVILEVVLQRFQYPQIVEYQLDAQEVCRRMKTPKPTLKWAREWVAENTYRVRAQLRKR